MSGIRWEWKETGVAILARFVRCSGVDAALAVDPTWQFVGFDVADDTTGVSGLSNCGYGAELAELRRDWASRLNDRGLFSALEDAFAFRALTDARVPEHAPFIVCGIWIVVAQPA